MLYGQYNDKGTNYCLPIFDTFKGLNSSNDSNRDDMVEV